MKSNLVTVLLFAICCVLGCTDPGGASKPPRLLDSDVAEGQDSTLSRLSEMQAVRGRMRPLGCYKTETLADFPGSGLVLFIEEDDDCAYHTTECEGGFEPPCYECAEGGAQTTSCAQTAWYDLIDEPFDPDAPDDDSDGVPDSVTDDTFKAVCARQVTGFCGGSGAPPPACHVKTCEALRNLCKANTVLEVTGARAAPLSVRIDNLVNYAGGAGVVEFPAQSTATNAGLAELARLYARSAAFTALAALHNAAGLPSPDASCDEAEGFAAGIGTLGNDTPAQVLPRVVKDAYDVYYEATQRAVELNVAYAEKARNNPNLQTAVNEQMLPSALSRTHAAQLLIGGSEGLAGAQLETGLCTLPEPSTAVRKAIDVFRKAGSCPADLTAIPGQVPDGEGIELFDLLYSLEEVADPEEPPPGVPSSGSVLQRFMDQYGVQPDYNFEEAFGLKDKHFEEARVYLLQEMLSLGRDQFATLDDPNADDYQVFAATRNPPAETDPIYYACAARHSDGGRTAVFSPSTYALQDHDAPSLDGLKAVGNFADFSEQVYSLAAQVVGSDMLGETASTINATLGFLLSSASNDIQGRLTVCQYATGEKVVADVRGLTASDGAVLVNGESGLACAVQGTVDGARCSLFGGAMPRAAFAFGVDVPTDVDVVAGYRAGVQNSEDGTASALAERLYLVKPKPGFEGSTSPGAYEAIAAVAKPGPDECVIAPVNKEAFSQAGRILAPSPKWCSHPAQECDGSLFDQRIALEDELAEDSDGVESSWRHYLALARQAAAEADLLGQDYLSAGLELDRRDEELELRRQANELAALHELEKLQSICGTNVEPAILLASLREDGAQDDFTGMVVPGSSCISDEGCAADAECHAGKCLRDTGLLVEASGQIWNDPELKKLARCLGEGPDGEVYSSVAVGDKDLCFWREPDDPNRVCTPPPGACTTDAETGEEVCEFRACPVAVQDGEACPPHPWYVDESVPMERTTMRLDFFEAEAEQVTSRPLHLANSFTTLLRNGKIDALGVGDTPEARIESAMTNVRGLANLFYYKNIAEWAQWLNYHAEPGTNARVKLHGSTLFTTGSLKDQSPSAWPCEARDFGLCDDDFDDADDRYVGSLGCEVIDCSDDAQRAEFVVRLRNAVVALKFLTTPPVTVRDAPEREYRIADVSAAYGFESTTWKETSRLLPFPGPEEIGIVYNTPKVINLGGDDEGSPITSEEQPAGAQGWYPDDYFSAEPTRLWHFYGTLNADYESPGPLRDINDDNIVDPVPFLPGAFATYPHLRLLIPESTCRQLPSHSWDGLAQVGFRQGLPTSEEFSCGRIFVTMAQAPTRSFDFVGKLDSQLKARYGGELREGLVTHEITLGRQELFDAMELYTMVRQEAAQQATTLRHCQADSGQPLNVTSIEGLEALSGQLVCMAENIENVASNTLLFGFPEQAVDALKEESGVGAFPELGGELGKQVSVLRGALVELQTAGPMIASHINQLGFDIDQLRLVLQSLEYQDRLNALNAEREMFAQQSRCSEGLLGGVASAVSTFGASLAVAAATCANSQVQSGLIQDILDVQNGVTANNEEIEKLNLRRNFDNRAVALQQLADGLAQSQERLDQTLIEIQNLRQAAKRALDNALWLESRQASQQDNINAAVRRRFNTARIRYEEAHQYATRMALLARRAIEARLGVRLETMDEPLPLVDAPSGWAGDVCASSALDYDAIRSELPQAEEGQANYADGFVGDYVRRLGAVVESYRLVYNFHEGVDTAMVSLRDDVFNTRAACNVPSRNLIVDSGSLLQSDSWEVAGCADPVPGEPLDCVSVVNGAEPPSLNHSGMSSALGARVTFGPGPLYYDGSYRPCDGCALTSETRYTQTVELEPGDYLLSWYAKQVVVGGSADPFNPDGNDSLRVLDANGQPLNVAPASGEPIPDTDGADSGWQRFSWRFRIGFGAGGQYQVAIIPSASGGTVVAHEVFLAAPMLERDVGQTGPSPFESTNEEGLVSVETCEDSDGSEFRATRWRHDCLLLCDNGFSGDCSRDRATEHCFYETSFHVSQEDVEQGGLFQQSGFALGNFNYRIEDVALNIVGTDTRNCEDSELPSSCYSAGFVPYSIVHQGPYYVRNHEGEDFEVPLFTGNIEHARALATERYLSNPLSESDRGLIDGYRRFEFQGRPLHGSFAIRLWEDEGFDFEQVQDVQLMLGYRYWTRFD